ncbi:unnamed protein product [Sympodiomycopsis kandeliae]
MAIPNSSTEAHSSPSRPISTSTSNNENDPLHPETQFVPSPSPSQPTLKREEMSSSPSTSNSAASIHLPTSTAMSTDQSGSSSSWSSANSSSNAGHTAHSADQAKIIEDNFPSSPAAISTAHTTAAAVGNAALTGSSSVPNAIDSALSTNGSPNGVISNDKKAKFASGIRRGGWRNVASVASSRDHSDNSSGGEDESKRSGTSKPRRSMRPSQRRINSTAGPSRGSSHPRSRLADSPSVLRRGSSQTLEDWGHDADGDDDWDGEDDDDLINAAGFDGNRHGRRTSGQNGWSQFQDRSQVMTPPGFVIELPSSSVPQPPPPPSSSSSTPQQASSSTPTGEVIVETAPEIDWANFVHAYSRGRWDPNKPLKAPGRSSAFPGTFTNIIMSCDGAPVSDDGFTSSDHTGGGGSRRPSLVYESESEAAAAKPQPLSVANDPSTLRSLTSAMQAVLHSGKGDINDVRSTQEEGHNNQSQSIGAVSRPQHVVDGQNPSRPIGSQAQSTGAAPVEHRSQPGKTSSSLDLSPKRSLSYTRTQPSQAGQQPSPSKVTALLRDAAALQLSAASSPELTTVLANYRFQDKRDHQEILDKAQRASKSVSEPAEQQGNSVKQLRNETARRGDDSVWHPNRQFTTAQTDILGQDITRSGNANGQALKPMSDSIVTPATKLEQSIPHISDSVAIAITEGSKRAASQGPQRPGPTPVQIDVGADANSMLAAAEEAAAAQRSAPAGQTTGEAAKRQEFGRSGSDPLSSVLNPSSVAGLRQAARRSTIKRDEDDTTSSATPTTIHSQSNRLDPLDGVAAPTASSAAEALTAGQLENKFTVYPGPPSLLKGHNGIEERSHDHTVAATTRESVPPAVNSRRDDPEEARTVPDSAKSLATSRAGTFLASPSNSYISSGRKMEEFFSQCGYLPAIAPPNEEERREALRRYGPPRMNGDANFDRLGHLVRLVFNCQIVLISLVGSTQQVFQTSVGGGGDYTAETLQQIAGSRQCSFCAHAILQTNEEPLVVLNAQKDWRFMGNPLVMGTPNIRFYAGTPLRTSDGFNLGSLCLIDSEPRNEFSPRQRHTLKEFGRVVMRELELTRDQIQLHSRDRMQKSIELFTRDCLQLEVDSNDDGHQNSTQVQKPKSGMGNLYNIAATSIHETLRVSGALVFDLSHFEVIESPAGASGPKTSKIFFPSPCSAPDVTPYANFDDPSVIETITSTPGPRDEAIKSKDVPPMSILGSSESGSIPPNRNRLVPLTHHIKVAEFLRKHRTGHFYPMIPSVFRHLLPEDAASLLLVPITGLNKQPFALLCAYARPGQEGPILADVKETALQYMRSMGTIILSAVLKKDIILADQAKSHFISNISHELRTPLHGILASAELLAETKLNATQGSYLETVEACGKSLLELVNHVLDFTKLSGNARSKGAPPHGLTPTDLVKLLQEVCESSWIGQMARKLESQQSAGIGSVYATGSGQNATVGSHGIGISSQAKQMKSSEVETVVDVSLRKDGWLVNCDAGGVRRVLMNLIGNALKFTTAGFVHISLREVQSTPTHVVVELSVTDTGRGISKSFLEEQLFHPFTQENQLGPGTGLGLSIVNSIVQSPSMNGKIDVWSTIGEGTEMRITCEMALAQPQDIDGPVYRPSLNLHESKFASLVGFQGNRGQLDLRQVLRNYFEGWWNFGPCQDSEDSCDGDIIVINEKVELLETIVRRRKVLPPVILLTSARGDAGTTEACRAYHKAGGIARIVFKPTGPSKLEAVVDFCLQCAERIERGEPPDISQTSPTTPLPSPIPSPAVAHDDGEIDNYFAARPQDDDDDSAIGACVAVDGETPMGIGGQTPTAATTLDGRTPTSATAAKGQVTPTSATPKQIDLPATRPPLAPLRSDSHHVSPSFVDKSAAILIRRHSAEEEVSRMRDRELREAMADNDAVQERQEVQAEGRAGRPQTAVPSSNVAKSGKSHPLRPLLPARSITFHTEPRLSKQAALSPLAVHQTESKNEDYFTSRKPATPTVPSSNASPGQLVSVEGSSGGDGHVLKKSALGTVQDPKPSGKRLRILGVDDNEINIKVLAAFLGKMNVDFTPALSGEECLRLYDSSEPFDVVIADLTMPLLDGFQVTAAIRQRETQSKTMDRIKILCLTGRNTEEDKRKAFAAGADGFITRPLSLRSLSSIIRLLTRT